MKKLTSKLTTLLCTSTILTSLTSAKETITPETITTKEVWISPNINLRPDSSTLVTVWFDKQLLGDGTAYNRRAKEFSEAGRRELRTRVIASLKKFSDQSYSSAENDLEKLLKSGDIKAIKRHWIVNGFTCQVTPKGLESLAKIKGVSKIFSQSRRPRLTNASQKPESITKFDRPTKPSTTDLPWYIAKLHADKVWTELGITGQGTLNIVHDSNFILTPSLARNIYNNPKEIPNNGKDDDANGLIDDSHGFNFNTNTASLTTKSLTGEPRSDRKSLHGTSCAHIISGATADNGAPQFGIAPMSRWAGVITSANIESAVEWAIEQGADTYSMSFSAPHLGEKRSHWRKVMEHGSFCGLFFVSGAGNFAQTTKIPVQMRTPEDIPEAVFAAAGVHQDLTKTIFSSKGPVEWNTEHYKDGIVQKPEVCAFNHQVPLLMPDGTVIPGALNGNSFAGPMFCGTISLMLSADPDLLPWDLKKIITSTATDVAAPGLDYETGHGLINCYAAVKEVLRQKDLKTTQLKKKDKMNSEIATLAAKQLTAYNNHDIDAFVNCYHPEVIVLNSEGKITTQGHQAFRKNYQAMFARGNFSATVETRIHHGDHCVDLEHWKRINNGKEITGSVIVRYTLKDNLIGTVQFLK
ncbi:MAG: S8 family serine peptidase [Akkermansiaceae bacterium]